MEYRVSRLEGARAKHDAEHEEFRRLFAKAEEERNMLRLGVDGLTTQDKIDRAVATALENADTRVFGRRERIVGGLIAASAVGGLLLQLVLALGGHQ